MSTTARPLLSGMEADAARSALSALSLDLFSPPRRALSGSSLAHGHAGMAVAHGYLSQHEAGTRHADAARSSVRRAVRALARERTTLSLLQGFTGVAWAIQHTSRLPAFANEPEFDLMDSLSDIDEALLQTLQMDTWEGAFDLYDGLAGVAIYALSRMPQRSSVRMLSRVVFHLDMLATKRGDTVA